MSTGDSQAIPEEDRIPWLQPISAFIGITAGSYSGKNIATMFLEFVHGTSA